ncbi:hypothetical protein [Hyphococcus sp.]|uniref:hypothetical protein n=1 Tax=Hyphococcus sp. TaxID=2038636 RepID=UPI0035C679C8
MNEIVSRGSIHADNMRIPPCLRHLGRKLHEKAGLGYDARSRQLKGFAPMRFRISAITVLAMVASSNAIAHEQFFADVDFEIWQRHCHTNVDKYGQLQECWAVYQKQFQRAGEYDVGFVIIVDERSWDFSFELRSINRFGESMEVKIDGNEPFKLACHGYSCTPWTREGGPKIVEQMKKGNEMLLRRNNKNDKLVVIEDIVSLEGFVSARGQ